MLVRSRTVVTPSAHRATYLQSRLWNPQPPAPVSLLRPESKREKWLNKLDRIGYPTAHLSRAGGYIHQTFFELLQRDAQAVGVKFIFHSIHDLEVNVLTPALKARCTEEGLSAEGDYVELRNRLASHTDIFANPAEPTVEPETE